MKEKDALFCEEVYFCSKSSLAHSEPLGGTASNYHAFILIEYPDPFPKKISETKLYDSWLENINDFAKTRKAKVILIRNGKTNSEYLKIIFVDALKKKSCTFQFSGSGYRFFNLKLFVEAEDTVWSDEHFFLVCTNGKKDKCCAKFGFPVFKAMERQNRFQVYESSHFGGDRFAGNAILMPFGIYYGRLTKESVEELVSTTEKDQILKSNYRGLSIYKFAKQSAEIYLRDFLGNYNIHFPVEFLHGNIAENSAFFEMRLDGETFRINMQKVTEMSPNLLTCTTLKREPVTKFILQNVFKNED